MSGDGNDKPLADADDDGHPHWMINKNKPPNDSDELTFSTNQNAEDDGKQPITLYDCQQPITEQDTQSISDTEIELDKPKVPDGGWGWFIVLGSFLTHMLMGGFERSSGVMYLQLKDKFEMSATETSWVIALFSTLRLLMGPVASALCNKFSIRTVVFLGSFMSTVGVLISAFAPNLRFLYFSYGILTGFGRALTYCPCLIIVGYYFNKRRGIAVGLATSGVGIGSFLFPPTIEKMFDHFGFQGTFIVLAGVISNFFVCGAFFRPLELHRRIMASSEIRSRRKATPGYEDSKKNLLKETAVTMEMKGHNLLTSQNASKMSSSMEITANAKIMKRNPSFFKLKLSQMKMTLKGNDSDTKEKKPLLELSLFRNYAFSVLCVQLLLFTVSFNATFVFLPAIAKDKGMSKIEGAYLLSILGICDAVARIVMSMILDLKRIKQYRLLIYNFLMLWVGVVSLVIPSMSTFWQFAIVSASYGCMSGTYISQKSVVVVDILGVEKLSSSFGLILLFQGIGSLLGPLIGAMFKDFLGSYDMSFYFGSMGIFLGAIVLATGNVWLFLQRRKQSATHGEKQR